ncbi:unnamed protein product [Withania somnifera]
MDRFLITLLFSSFCFLCLFATTCYSLNQNWSAFAFRDNQNFSTCIPLPVLNSVLHWTYHPDNHTVDLAYRHGGSGQIHAYNAPVTSYGTQVAQGALSFNLPRIAAEFSNNEFIIFATLELPAEKTSFNQAWQNGGVAGQALLSHVQSGYNMWSLRRVDFANGQLGSGGS